jgi:hypothetical protein
MKKTMVIFAILTLAPLANAQATNPQKTFWGAEWAANPALVLNFNDSTTSFKEQVSGNSLSTTYTYTSPTYVNTCTFIQSGATATCSITTYAGELLIIDPAWYSTAAITSVTDSGGATASLVATQALTSGGGYISYYVMPNLSAGTHTISVTWTATPSYPGTVAMGYLGVNTTSPVDTYVSAVGGPSTAVSSGALTTTAANEGLYGGFLIDNAPNITQGTPAFNFPLGLTIYPGWLSAPTIGSYTFNITSAASKTWAAIEIALKPGTQTATLLTGTITPHQPGFDSTNNSNYSAEFAYNAGVFASTPTLSTIDWNSPWSMLLHIDNLNWDHSGTLILASKGDLTGCLALTGCGSTSSFWKLFLQVNTFPTGNTASELCFARNGYGANQSYQYVCTNIADAMPNGMNYDIVIEDAGTGGSSSLSLYLNGMAVFQTASESTSNGFGNAALTLVSGGSGYAATTTFTNAGTGGPNCNINGAATATSGVITSIGIYSGSGNYNYGCTSTPTISFVAPTGTGASITAAAVAMSMNSSTSPLMVPGYVSNGQAYGVGGTDSSQNPVYIDEFALFNTALTFGQVTNLFYPTKFWQSLIYPGLLANPPLVILGGYGCGPDFSGDQTLAMTIGAAKQGLIHLIGVTDDDGNPNGSNSVGWWRQMLDQAGLNDVPVSVGPSSADANLGGCPAATITSYNASTPQNASSYPSTVTMYRTLFAKYPTSPIYVLATQTGNGYAAFLTSAADSISPLTGLQLQSQNAANGGYVNMYQGNLSITPTANTTIYNNNGTMPVYIFGGVPSTGGPGILVSRTANDPLYLVAANQLTDYISGYTQLNLAQTMSPYFYGGVTVSYSGGTGYANSTPFTSTGGGTYCHVTGIMTASGGVPNGIQTYYAEPFPPTITYNGLGYGCFNPSSPPTIVLTAPTGTGVTLTATPGLVPTCYGTAGCSNQYVVYADLWSQTPASTGAGQVFSWFQNSLMDPPPNGAPRPN